MSLQKQVKSVLKSRDVSELVVEYENGSTKEYSLDGKKGGKSEIKSLLKSIDWEDVAEVQFVLDEDDDDEDDDSDDEDNDEDSDDDEDDDGDYDDEDGDDEDDYEDDDDDEDYDDDDYDDDDDD